MNEINNCICCNTKLETDLNSDGSVMYVYRGSHQEITIGYGSVKHDGDTIEFSICDSCITEKIENGNMFVQGNLIEELSKLPKGKVVTVEKQEEINDNISNCSFKFVKK